MKLIEIAGRYGRSVFELAEEKGVTDTLFQELSAVRDAMQTRPELLNLLQSPVITRGEKRSLIEGILGPRANALSGQFLNLLVDKNRIILFPEIVDELRGILREKKGLQEATIVTARQLHPSILQLLQKALETTIKKKIIIHTEVDPQILGGIQIRLGNRMLDGSVRAKMAALETQLRNVKV